jgi:hypothetical protein
MQLAIAFGLLGIFCLWKAIQEQRQDPAFEKVHVWFYTSLPVLLLHSGFYFWYALRINP